jgi:arginase family enzyme
MLGTDAGLAALDGWARTVAGRVDAFYVAFDLDALDAAGDWALAMPEPNGIGLETALAAVRTIAAAGPVIGFGATAILIGRGGDPDRTLDAVVRLADAALGDRTTIAPDTDRPALGQVRGPFGGDAGEDV